MNNRSLLKSLPLLGVLVVAVYVGGLVAKEPRTSSLCQSNLKQIGLGMRQYMRDYDAKLPLASYWMKSTLPYTRERQFYRCPSPGVGYSFNRYTSSFFYGDDSFDAGERALVTDSTSTKAKASDLGESWPRNGVHSLLKNFRIKRGNNVLYLDTHVKWV